MNTAQRATISDSKVDSVYVIEGGLPHAPSPSEVYRRKLKTYGGSFLKACGLVVLVSLCHLLVDSVNIRGRGVQVDNSIVHAGDWEGHVNGWPTLPTNVTLSQCATWHQVATFEASTSLEVSSTLDLLSFLSRGPSSFGSIQIVHSNVVGTNVKVNIHVKYNRADALSRTKVCTINGPIGNSGGVAILSWRGFWWPPKMTFSVDVEIPATPDGSPSHIKGLRTDMPIFVHNIGDLSKTVHFKSVSLETSNSPISVKSISAEHAKFSTTNGGIDGSFDVFSSLMFTTTNGPIKADVGLHDYAAGSELVASTTNALIKTFVSLFSHKAGNTGGQFKVSATNSNGAVTIDFPTAPVDSLLSLDAKSSIGATIVTLHPTYEGTFEVSTTISKPVLNYNPSISDPAGEGRVRKVDARPTIQEIDGSVAWVKPGANLRDQLKGGSVKVATTIGKAVLNLNP